MNDELLTPKEVCKRWSISIHTLYKWTSLRLIPFTKIGGLLRFRKADLDNWAEEGVQTPLI